MTPNKTNWVENFMAVSSVVVPMSLILLSILTPKSLVDQDQKDTLLTAGLTALVTGGFRGLGRKTEIRQEVQTQELNLAESRDYLQYNPPRYDPNKEYQQTPYLSQVQPEEERFLDSREHVASSPYRVVSPDDN